MIIELASVALIVGEWVYHRLTEQEPYRQGVRGLEFPRVANGTPVPLIYGRCRVREPVVTWAAGSFDGDALGGISNSYQIKMALTLGIPFQGGTNVVHNFWVGDELLRWEKLGGGGLGVPQTGDGNFEAAIALESSDLGGYVVHGTMETLNGKSTQTLVDDAGTATTNAGAIMMAEGVSADDIPGMRGVMTAFLHKDSSTDYGFAIGPNPNIPVISLECSSYKAHSWLNYAYHHKINDDANPMCVAYDLFTATLGKAGIASTYIHEQSFRVAAQTLYEEQHGFSACLGRKTLGEHIRDIERQCDCVFYEDPSDQKIHVKLIRADYTAANLPEINRSNCKSIENFAIGNGNDIDRVIVLYSSREHDYNERDAPSTDTVNGTATEVTLSFPGITTRALALTVADRELGALGRPIIKMRAIVDRSWYYITPGAVVRVRWTSPDIGNLVFRVGRVDRGTLTDGQIALDLILDTAYVAPRTGRAEPVSPPVTTTRTIPDPRL